ncbi:hypothetical protein OQA88_12053 [Cercophora sp. LCS_1]
MTTGILSRDSPLFSSIALDHGPLFANANERARAVARFYHIVNHFKSIETSRPLKPYNRAALIHLTFEYARSAESQDRFLAFFFRSLAISMFDGDVTCSDPDLGEAFLGVAELLMTNFLPLRASAHKTPQPSPAHREALQQVLFQEEQRRIDDFIGTPERLSALRESCLIRDRHRCVVTHAFDQTEAKIRFKGQDGQALDDDGNPLVVGENYDFLEVAHIIPYALTKAEDNQIGEGKKTAIAILNMFDLGVAHLIEGAYINRSYNALTLSLGMHKSFGQYEIFFEHLPDADAPSTYRIGTFLQPALARPLPVVKTLFAHSTIGPPSERLLALHRAIAHILHLSGAGDYIDTILKDIEDGVVREDGSTQLGLMVDLALRVHSWTALTCPK